jgi:hypothetical protein
LRGFGKQLRQAEGSDALYQRGPHHGQNQRPQQVVMTLADDIVHQIFRGGRQHQPRHTIDGHQHHAESQQAPSRPHQCPDIGQQRAQAFGLGQLGRI